MWVGGFVPFSSAFFPARVIREIFADYEPQRWWLVINSGQAWKKGGWMNGTLPALRFSLSRQS